jgi:hypothetical protein
MTRSRPAVISATETVWPDARATSTASSSAFLRSADSVT